MSVALRAKQKRRVWTGSLLRLLWPALEKRISRLGLNMESRTQGLTSRLTHHGDLTNRTTVSFCLKHLDGHVMSCLHVLATTSHVLLSSGSTLYGYLYIY